MNQKALPFTPPAEPLPQLNPTAPKERRASLQRKCLAILGRLQYGPATNAELLVIGGFRYGARLGELRVFGHHIRTEVNAKTGLVLYTLDISAQGAGGKEVDSGKPSPAQDVEAGA